MRRGNRQLSEGSVLEAEAAPILELICEGVTYRLSRGAAVSVGRRMCHVTIADRRLSLRHLIVRWDQGWIAEDNASRTGTYLEGRRVAEVLIAAPITLSLGAAAGGVPIRLAPAIRTEPAQAPAVIDLRDKWSIRRPRFAGQPR